VDEKELLRRITYNPDIYGGKPIIRGRRMAVEHILGMLAAGDTAEDLVECYRWLEREDVLACLLFAYKMVAREPYEPRLVQLSGGGCCSTLVFGKAPAPNCGPRVTTSSGLANGLQTPATPPFWRSRTGKGAW